MSLDNADKVIEGGPGFEMLERNKERVPRCCVLCKGGYHAVCMMRFSVGSNPAPQAASYPPFAKNAKSGAPTFIFCVRDLKAGPPGQPASYLEAKLEATMRNITLRTLCWLLATAVCTAQAAAKLPQDQLSRKDVEAQYRFQESYLTLHEPVVLLFSLHNGLAEPVMLQLGADNQTQFFQFLLSTPDGRTLQNPRNPGDYVSVAIFGSGKTEVAPGTDYSQSILMNQWFRFETVGTYLLTAQLTAGVETPDGASPPAQSRSIRLEVRPRDSVRLENLCAALARQVLDNLSVEEWKFPTRMLSSIDDPIAVPYLGQALLTNKGTEKFVIPALERIGGDNAVQVLASALDDKSGDIAELARQSLTRMQGQIGDPGLKERVRRALAQRHED